MHSKYCSLFYAFNRIKLNILSIQSRTIHKRKIIFLSFSTRAAADSFRNPSHVPLDSETHGGEDVAIFARGPMSHLFHGVQEQSYIAHAMAYASCVGVNQEHCTNSNVNASSKSCLQINYLFILLVLISHKTMRHRILLRHILV